MKTKPQHTPAELVAMKKKLKTQVKICERAERELELRCSRMSLMMDLESVELDIEKLLNAPAFDFAHDIYGIIRHMDRSQYPGKLTDCFLPRCSA
jgi:hypothetical protein